MDNLDSDLVVVIMAGGAGTRFWPLSTKRRPKQFLRLFGERSLLQMSYDRVRGIVSPERVFILTNADFTALVRAQLPDIPGENVIGEPYRRDTAAAVGLASLLIEKRLGAAVVATLTADHLIEPIEVFQRTLLSAAMGARQAGALYTFGIRPGYAATGYGYLELGEKVLEERGIEHYRLVQFREKPDAATAEEYVRSGGYLWNSGMFVWTVSAILEELERNLPAHLEALAKAVAADRTPQWEGELEAAFQTLEAISIDYGVMEKAANVRCVASSFSWSDVGGWLALADHLSSDDQGNRHRGRVVSLDAKDNIVFCEEAGDTVMLVGVEGLVVVRTGDKILVTSKARTEDIKPLVKRHDLE